MQEELLPETVPIGVLSVLFGVTERQVRNLLSEAGAKPAMRGRWPLAATVRAVFDKARESRVSSELAKARARAIAASARKTELATARAERELVPREDVDITIAAVCAAVRQEFDGLPARLTRDRTERVRIDNECRSALGRIAASVEAHAQALETGEIADAEE